MTDIDKEIARALNDEDQELAKEFEEQGLIGQFASVFKGKTAFVSSASLIFGTIMNFGFVYAAWRFFIVDGMEEKLLWGGGACFLMVMVGFIKMWFFIRMESNRVLRELKRVELQLARMQTRLPSKD